jgi:lipid A disaccharide synthetase
MQKAMTTTSPTHRHHRRRRFRRPARRRSHRRAAPRYPQARFVGIGGARMQAAGLRKSWYDIHELSLFGFSEVISHLPRLLRLRKELVARLLAEKPACRRRHRRAGFQSRRRAAPEGGRALLTVHYVSPSVWAWRENRAEKIGRSANRVLCLFPMEPPIYAKHGIDARFVGHPLADRFRAGVRPRRRVAHCSCRRRCRCWPCCPAAALPNWRGWAQIFLDAAPASPLQRFRACAS